LLRKPAAVLVPRSAVAAAAEASIGARLDQLEGLLVKAFPALRGDAYVAVAGS
jgi:hypothetical protein